MPKGICKFELSETDWSHNFNVCNAGNIYRVAAGI